jgi:hypothetical protein
LIATRKKKPKNRGTKSTSGAGVVRSDSRARSTGQLLRRSLQVSWSAQLARLFRVPYAPAPRRRSAGRARRLRTYARGQFPVDGDCMDMDPYLVSICPQSASSLIFSVSQPGRSPALPVSSLSPAPTPTLLMQRPGGHGLTCCIPAPNKAATSLLALVSARQRSKSKSHALPARGKLRPLCIYRQDEG